MVKKFFLLALLGNLHQPVQAERCPSVTALRHETPKGWALYDSEDGTPLSKARRAQFKRSITQFVLAEWIQTAKRGGSIHCYYRDKTGASLEAYAAKDQFVPVDSQKVWYRVSGFMHCAAGVDKCLFKNYPLKEQYAKR